MFPKLICLLCFTLWEMDVSCTPVRYSEGGAIYHPGQLMEYQRIPDNMISRNSTQLLPQEGSEIISAFPEKFDRKRQSTVIKTTRIRRTPTGFSARGFHEEVFDRDFGHFSPVKRRPEADAAGFYGDTFSNGFGEFETMKRRMPSYGFKAMSKMDMMDPRFLPRRYLEGKRNPEMSKSGFHSDVFSGGFGEFHPM